MNSELEFTRSEGAVESPPTGVLDVFQRAQHEAPLRCAGQLAAPVHGTHRDRGSDQ